MIVVAFADFIRVAKRLLLLLMHNAERIMNKGKSKTDNCIVGPLLYFRLFPNMADKTQPFTVSAT